MKVEYYRTSQGFVLPLQLQDILAQEIPSFEKWLYSMYLETFFIALSKVICRFPSPFSSRGSVEGLVQID